MLDNDELHVWYQAKRVGYLWRSATEVMGFRYDQDWLDQGGFAISRTLPLGAGDVTPADGHAHRFFANLLPEGAARDAIVRDLKIADNDFDLLRHIGGECAGALSLLIPEQDPSLTHQYLPLGPARLRNLVQRRGQMPGTASAHERPRLSLAGAQQKCAVLFADGRYRLPRDNAPSTHILKFESADYRNLPTYETFTMQLAAAIGLPVVDVELCNLEQHQFVRVARYDRVIEGDDVMRLHQEDFCQALGYSYARKYQHDGGPNFADCVRLLRHCSHEPSIDVPALFRWQIFNVLAGNSDGHAKNLSLLLDAQGRIRLAPFYDLVCTRAIEHINENLAFSVGEEHRPARVTASDWQALAKAGEIAPRLLKRWLEETATALLAHLELLLDDHQQQHGDTPALERIERVVRKQCRLLSRELKKY